MLKSILKFRKKIAKESASPEITRTGSTADNFAKQHVARVAIKTEEQLKKDADRFRDKRAEERAELTVISEMTFPEKGYSVDGIITDASKGGCTFRPATNYLEERTGEHILIVIEQISRRGVIRSTRANGYGVQLLEKFTENDLLYLQNNSVALVRDEMVQHAS